MIRNATHRAIVREKDKQIADLLAMVESQSERLLVVAGYRPLIPKPVQMREARKPDPELEAFADAVEL